MVDDPVEDDDDKLLELLRQCSEPDGVPTQEKTDLDKAMRDQFGEAWEQAADYCAGIHRTARRWR